MSWKRYSSTLVLFILLILQGKSQETTAQIKLQDQFTYNSIENASIWIKNTSTGDTKEVKPENGIYYYDVDQKSNYEVWCKKYGYLKKYASIEWCGDDKPGFLYCVSGFARFEYTDSILDLDLRMEKIDLNKSFTLKNIYYDLDKYYIRRDAEPDLNKLTQILNDNPEIVVELGSHTDSRASDEYNNELSQNRAEAAVAYILKKGITKSRIEAKGYGETILVNDCGDGKICSSAQHQANRRTEFRVTKILPESEVTLP